jgi:hypothetical protein
VGGRKMKLELLQKGNMKLGNSIYTYSATPGATGTWGRGKGKGKGKGKGRGRGKGKGRGSINLAGEATKYGIAPPPPPGGYMLRKKISISLELPGFCLFSAIL